MSRGDSNLSFYPKAHTLFTTVYRIPPVILRSFLNPSSLGDVNTMSSAYLRKSMGLFQSLVPILFFASSVSSPLMNRVKRRGLRLQPCLTPISQCMELVCDLMIWQFQTWHGFWVHWLQDCMSRFVDWFPAFSASSYDQLSQMLFWTPHST